MKNTDSISQEEFERIERYLLGAMRPDEQLSLEKELAENKVLSAQFKKVEAVLNGIEEIALRENLDAFHLEWDENRHARKKSHKIGIPLSIAAFFLLLAGFFTWLFWMRPDANEQLFATYYQADPGLVTAMGSSEDYAFDRGMVDYKMGKFAPAIQRWEALLPEKPSNDTLHYFLGSAHLGLKNTAPAKMYLDRVTAQESSAFREDAFWYLALVNVLDKDYEKALLNLKKSNHPEKEELIKTIKEK